VGHISARPLLPEGGLFAEDGSVLYRAGRYFGRIAEPIKKISGARGKATPLTLPSSAAQVKAGPW